MKKKYQDSQFRLHKSSKNIQLGKQLSYEWDQDPKHLVFSLSRYKFVSKMFDGYKNVLEIGAGDGFKSGIVDCSVKNLILSDYNDEFKDNYTSKNYYIVHDFTKSSISKKFDGIYLLDVLEHINKNKENKFILNITKSLKKSGSLIVGMPSLASQKYASKISKVGHVNCKNKIDLKKFLDKYFHNVFIFSMNDEVLHTGFDYMSHYIFAICCFKRN